MQLINTHNNSRNLSLYQTKPTIKQEITNTSNYKLRLNQQVNLYYEGD